MLFNTSPFFGPGPCRLLTLFLVLTIAFSSKAQVVEWNPESEIPFGFRKDFLPLGNVGNIALYLEVENKKQSIVRYGENGELLGKQELNIPGAKNFQFIRMTQQKSESTYQTSQGAFASLRWLNRKTKKVELLVFRINNEGILDEQPIKLASHAFREIDMSNSKMVQWSRDFGGIAQSPNGDGFAFINDFLTTDEKSKDETYMLYTFDASLSGSQSYDIQLPFADDEFRLEDLSISDDGDVFLSGEYQPRDNKGAKGSVYHSFQIREGEILNQYQFDGLDYPPSFMQVVSFKGRNFAVGTCYDGTGENVSIAGVCGAELGPDGRFPWTDCRLFTSEEVSVFIADPDWVDYSFSIKMGHVTAIESTGLIFFVINGLRGVTPSSAGGINLFVFDTEKRRIAPSVPILTKNSTGVRDRMRYAFHHNKKTGATYIWNYNDNVLAGKSNNTPKKEWKEHVVLTALDNNMQVFFQDVIFTRDGTDYNVIKNKQELFLRIARSTPLDNNSVIVLATAYTRCKHGVFDLPQP